MEAFYPLLNFSEEPIFFGADKSSFHITLLKGTAVKTSKEKYTPQGSLASGVNKHTSLHTQSSRLPLAPASFLTKDQWPAAHLGPGRCGEATGWLVRAQPPPCLWSLSLDHAGRTGIDHWWLENTPNIMGLPSVPYWLSSLETWSPRDPFSNELQAPTPQRSPDARKK